MKRVTTRLEEWLTPKAPISNVNLSLLKEAIKRKEISPLEGDEKEAKIKNGKETYDASIFSRKDKMGRENSFEHKIQLRFCDKYARA